MPILQTRVISIIQIGLTYRQAYQQLAREVKRQLTNAQIQSEPTTRLETLLAFSGDLPFGLTTEQELNLLQESEHFSKTQSQNMKRAARLRERRQTKLPSQPKTKTTYDPNTTIELSGKTPEKELF